MTVLNTTVEGPAVISFDVWLSPPAAFMGPIFVQPGDPPRSLTLLVDGEPFWTESMAVPGWQTVRAFAESGSHTLTWRYAELRSVALANCSITPQPAPEPAIAEAL